MDGSVHSNKVLAITTETNAIDYLEKSYYFICQTVERPYAWKWVAISLHGALYGFAVSALIGPSWPDFLITDNKRTRAFKAHKHYKHIKQLRGSLIGFDNALRNCQTPKAMYKPANDQYPENRNVLQLTEQECNSINKLKDALRNRFMHFKPGASYFRTDDFPKMALDVLGVIYYLAMDSGHCYRLATSEKVAIEHLVLLSCIKLYEIDASVHHVSEPGQPTFPTPHHVSLCNF